MFWPAFGLTYIQRILSDVYSDIHRFRHVIATCILRFYLTCGVWHSIWHCMWRWVWHLFRHFIWHISYIIICIYWCSTCLLSIWLFFCRSTTFYPLKKRQKNHPDVGWLKPHVRWQCVQWVLLKNHIFVAKLCEITNYAGEKHVFQSKIQFCYEQMFFFHSKIHCHGEVWFVHGRIFMNFLLFMVKVPLFSGELGALFWLRTREHSTVSASLLCTWAQWNLEGTQILSLGLFMKDTTTRCTKPAQAPKTTKQTTQECT